MDVSPSQILKVCSMCDSAINNDDVYCYSCGTRSIWKYRKSWQAVW